MSEATIVRPNRRTEFPLAQSLAAPPLASARAALPVPIALRNSVLPVGMALTWLAKELTSKLELQLTHDNAPGDSAHRYEVHRYEAQRYEAHRYEAFRQFYLKYPMALEAVAGWRIGSAGCAA